MKITTLPHPITSGFGPSMTEGNPKDDQQRGNHLDVINEPLIQD